ncbi:hypothetical protein [Candidatus Nitrospira bockiana]
MIAAISTAAACAGSGPPFDLTSLDPGQDQPMIAEHYRQHAIRFRQKAEDLHDRVRVYERLFGPSSDWVTGTRLLAQSYEEAAQEHERLARKHAELGRGRGAAASVPAGRDASRF